MKKIITTVMALTLALGMSVTALADQSPSQETKPVASVADVVEGATLTPEEQAVVDTWADNWDVEKAAPTNEQVAAIESAALEGTTNKEANVLTYGEVTVPEDMKALVNAGKVVLTLSFSVGGVTAADNGSVVAFVFHDGKWEPMKTVVTEDGAVLVAFTHFSPVAFVKVQEKTAAPANPSYNGWAGVDMAALWAAQTQAGATSPKTGEAGVVGFALIAVACGAALVFTKKKFA